MRTVLKKPFLIVLFIVVIDQITKFLVKTTMYIGQEYHFLGDWGRIHFIENNGMAFGMEFAGDTGKIILTLFRLVAVIALAIYISRSVRKNMNSLFLVLLSMIMAGALGNIIDSVFYGLIFNSSTPYQLASFMPEAGGYAPLMHGKVVDMFYFPILKGFWPDWVPLVGGKYYEFFRPIFNIADSAITLGVFGLIIFQRRFFKNTSQNE